MNSVPNDQVVLLTPLAEAFRTLQDPRDPRGVRRDFQGMFILIFLRLLARIQFLNNGRKVAKAIGNEFMGDTGFKIVDFVIDRFDGDGNVFAMPLIGTMNAPGTFKDDVDHQRHDSGKEEFLSY